MNDELQAKLVEIVTQIQAAVKAGADFAMEQLPDIAMQYIMYYRGLLTLKILLGIALVIVGAYVIRKGWKCLVASNSTEFSPLLIIPMGAFWSIGGTIISHNLDQFMMVWLAPKVFLITELYKLVK